MTTYIFAGILSAAVSLVAIGAARNDLMLFVVGCLMLGVYHAKSWEPFDDK